MKIGFTGTRKSMTQEQHDTLKDLIASLRPEEFHHGDCVGADTEAADIAFWADVKVIAHPPEDPKLRAYNDKASYCHPELPYLRRNQAIVESGDHMFAAPYGIREELRSGTWQAIRFARAECKPVTIVWPDGSYTEEQRYCR